MGVVGSPPETTEGFYEDGYYGTVAADVPGYSEYAFTAEHGLLWCRLIIEALAPPGGRILVWTWVASTDSCCIAYPARSSALGSRSMPGLLNKLRRVALP